MNTERYDLVSGNLKPICKDCDTPIVWVYSREDRVAWWWCPSCGRLHEDIHVVDKLVMEEIENLRRPDGGLVGVPRFRYTHQSMPGSKPEFDPNREMRVGIRYVTACSS